MPQCPHCNADVFAGAYRQHERACIANPAVLEAIRGAIQDPKDPKRAVSAERYNARRVLYGAPSDRTVVAYFDGSWEKAYTAFGLDRPLRHNEVQDEKAKCPYCKRDFHNNNTAKHDAICPANPAYYDAIRTAMQDAEFPDYAVSVQDYHARARAAGVAGVELLRQMYGTWAQVTAHFGLHSANNDELAALRAIAEARAIAQREAQLLREDEEQACRFTALRVQDAPGLYVNGRPCQRIELR